MLGRCDVWDTNREETLAVAGEETGLRNGAKEVGYLKAVVQAHRVEKGKVRGEGRGVEQTSNQPF